MSDFGEAGDSDSTDSRGVSEDDEDFKEVFGVEFYQPDDPYGLNQPNVTDDWVSVVFMIAGAIPILGLSFALAGLSVGYRRRKTNEFCLYEQSWKMGVYGMVLQIISLCVLALTMLV